MPEPVADPRPQLYAAFDQASRIVAAVRQDQLARPTTCAEFDVGALSHHIVGVARRVAALGRGEPQTGELDLSGIDEDGFAKAFDEARRAAVDGWDDDSILGKDMVLPWAQFPGAMAARVYTLELTTHAWDLASSTGQLDGLDPTLAEAVLPIAAQLLPPESRGGDLPFGPIVDVPPGATAYDRLAGYLGRRPI